MMKICFIGLGSIGTRHITNLIMILQERKISYQIDAYRSSKCTLKEELRSIINQEYYSFEELPGDYDIIFITNPTFLHYDAIQKVIHKTTHLFIEKPLFESASYDINKLTGKGQNIYYVACPLRYTPVVQYLKKVLPGERIYSIRAICSSYLPEWRIGVDYKEVYSAKKEHGGGVSLDLIHEWDYITYLFGIPQTVYQINGKYSELEITSDDISIYIAAYKNMLAELHLDYFGRKNTREIELYCKDYVIKADLRNNTLCYNGVEEKIITLPIEDMYKNEMNYFLDMVLEGEFNHNDINHAFEVLKLATGKSYC